jgi:manganese-dependent ADP-ribose/CDP-alcohol diphosphatase
MSFVPTTRHKRISFGFVWLYFFVALLTPSESFLLKSQSNLSQYYSMADTSADIKARFDPKCRSSSLGEESDGDYFHREEAGEDSQDTPPRFTVGLIADIQYAPIPDGASYSGNRRYYRHSLEVARQAFKHFEEEQVDLVLNLGDIIDGKCQNIALNGGDPVPEGIDPGQFSLDHVLEALSPYTKGPILHNYGNHCLYNLDRATLAEKLGIPFFKEPCGDLVGYFDHVHQGVRFVMIDSYDVAIMQRCENTSQKRKEASEILSKNNPNYAKNMNSPEGLEGLEKRFVGFNGAVGALQLAWLRQTLGEARKANEKVIILSHQPIIPESTSPVCLIWNYEDVLEILRDHADVVVASFSGHAHKGGYLRDPKSGIHFRVFEAALENRPERTYAMVDIHDDQLIVRGFGNCHSAVYDFEHNRKAANSLV